ncbi:unnamed protein product [Meganyctiphanes norvegica]|uniref:Gonadal protein gdl n=1 Tax=Meganyctiphanes norvegica TaxID=48144 RepID=A0AAV2SPU1_MEGNR
MYHQSGNGISSQQRLYELQERLQNMSKKIPIKYQHKLGLESLSTLAHLLLDDTVYQIVVELTELQQMQEKILHQQRSQIVNRHKTEQNALLKTQQQEVISAKSQGKEHVAARLSILHKQQNAELTDKHKLEILNLDEKILKTLDQKVAEQQSTLEQVGVPCFFVTDDAIEIRLQIYILGFIVKLGNIKVPP